MIYFIVAATVVASFVFMKFIWRQIDLIKYEFFQRARNRALTQTSVAMTMAVAFLCGAIAVEAILLDRIHGKSRAAQDEVVRLKLEISRMERQRLRTSISKSKAPAVKAPRVPDAGDTANRLRVSASMAVIRSQPGQERLFTLEHGEEVTPLGEASEYDGREWQEIRSADGRHGWIAASLLEPVT